MMECTSTTTPTTPPHLLSSPTSAFNPVPKSHKHSIDFLLNPPTQKEEDDEELPTSLIGRKRKAAFSILNINTNNNNEEAAVDSDSTRTYLFPHSPHVPHKKAMVIFHQDYTNPLMTMIHQQTSTQTSPAVHPLSPPVSSSSRSSSCKRRKTSNKNPATSTVATQQLESLLEEKAANNKKQDSSKLADLLDTAAGPNLFQKIQALPETPVPMSLEAVLRSDAFFNFNPATGGASDSECNLGITAFEASFPSKKGLAPLKTRKRPNSYQRAFLEYVFRLDPWPDTASKLLISQKIQMTPQQINTWFQNKRARSKKTTPSNTPSQGSAGELPVVFQQLLGIKG